MKKMILTLCAVVMSVMVQAQRVDTTPFDKVQVDVAARVRVVDGRHFGVTVRSTEKALAEDIQISVENGILDISSRGDYSATGDEETLITITCPFDVDIATTADFDAIDVETTPAEESVQHDAPRFPFMPHHRPMHMMRPWGHA